MYWDIRKGLRKGRKILGGLKKRVRRDIGDGQSCREKTGAKNVIKNTCMKVEGKKAKTGYDGKKIMWSKFRK